ncbi:7712_t:CDS:1, partial [Cetraspora pellucida]
MFKGFTEELQRAISNYNQNSKNFIFCACDLNYSSDRQPDEYKYDINSPELKTELGKIITAGGGTLSNPRGINF